MGSSRKSLEIGDMSGPPIPVAKFADDMKKVLDAQYKFGVNTTGKKVTKRLYEYFVKDKADFSSQTGSAEM